MAAVIHRIVIATIAIRTQCRLMKQRLILVHHRRPSRRLEATATKPTIIVSNRSSSTIRVIDRRTIIGIRRHRRHRHYPNRTVGVKNPVKVVILVVPILIMMRMIMKWVIMIMNGNVWGWELAFCYFIIWVIAYWLSFTLYSVGECASIKLL